MDGKRIRYLQIVSQHVPIYLQQFPSYSNRKCKKIAIFTYRSPHFLMLHVFPVIIQETRATSHASAPNTQSLVHR